MGLEMRSGFNPEGAVSNGLQIGREHQLLLPQQLEEEKNGFFELYSDHLYSTRSGAPSSSSSDSDSTMNGNYISSSSTITNGFSPLGRLSIGPELRMQQQQLQPDSIHESNLLNNGDNDAPNATSPNFSAITNEFHPEEFFLGQDVSNRFKLGGQQMIFDQNSSVDSPNMSSGAAVLMSSSSASDGNPIPELIPESNSTEDSEILSDMVLNYINRMLMEEDIDGKFDVYPEHPALLAAEKPFYDILEEKFLASEEPPLHSISNQESLDDSDGFYFESFNRIGDANVVKGKSQPSNKVEHHLLQTTPDSLNYSSFAYKNIAGSVMQGTDDYVSGFSSASESFPAWQFQKGLEEARKFLPSDDKLVISLESIGFSMPQEPTGGNLVQVKREKEDRKHVIHQSRGKKNHDDDDLDVQEGRSSKQSATSTEEIVRTKMFDEILLAKGEKCNVDIMNNDLSKSSHITHSKGSSGSRGRGKRQQNKKEVVDLRTLLIHCAQCVAIDDHRSAYELLKQIRKHADPDGDANQRLAHYFSDGLEARLAGTGSQIYHSLVPKKIPITDVLKAYALYMSACPFKRIGYYLSNQTILDASENATRLHIIDFGIYYGFQWPCFMQRLSNRPGGPPKLRITAIDTPVSGFRPTELIDETGRRLADYAQSFNIPFEYHAIATSWETVKEEDLNIDKDEVLIVNCLFRMKGVADETVLVDSPRDVVLNMIRRLNPAVFIHGIINGSYNAPFFVTRFREALFHFSALYDVIETNTPREDESRKLIEKVIYGREVLNIISCEGAERVERPETYKQWQVRNIRAGFVQLPLNPVIVKKARDKYKACYHKDFVIDEDNQWLLQGWKGRIIIALSTWKSNIPS